MRDTKKIKIGRPSDYTTALAEEICEAIACDSKGLRRLCNDNEHWPSRSNIYVWLKNHSEFQDLYARAKECQVEALIDEILEIADDSSNDYAINDEGKLIVNHEHIQRAKLRIDTRKWLAAKLCPRLYGDRLTDKPPVEDLISMFRSNILVGNN